ncbi:hypothetical protein KEM56_001042 [Ascosphaera pollenicola]|nr:hypothetical protein KEM56_001042 [Ascosphaera pollenicola]
MYNPYGSQNPYGQGRVPEYPAYPGAPPGMPFPPGMAPPGVAPIMGQPPAAVPATAGRPVGFPPSFQPLPNMPNINFNAPVIRLGTSGPSRPNAQQETARDRHVGLDSGRGNASERSGRAGLGSAIENQRQTLRETMLQLQPPTKDEIVRTLFIGGITEGVNDEELERILKTAGGLRRWIRPTDSDEKACKFGFAEFEDPEALKVAVEVLIDNIEVPVKRQTPRKLGEQEEDKKEVEKSKLMVVVDDGTLKYLAMWEDNTRPDPAATQQRIAAARASLATVLAEIEYPKLDAATPVDADGDTAMEAAGPEKKKDDTEVITIPIAGEDELSDIPPEMRATVAKEIAAFRERSNRRDLERLKREEEIESMERARNGKGRSSPPPSAPTGPSWVSNGIPLGPRGAPTGPKALVGGQKGVSFISANGLDNTFNDDDTDASDSELERRRQEKKLDDQEKHFLDQERRWLNRERSRTAAIEREKNRDLEEEARNEETKEIMAKKLREWNDVVEAQRKVEEYYADHGAWLRNRTAFRQREINIDEADRLSEEREKARDVQQREQALGMADDFLARQAEELESRAPQAAALREPQRFKMSLGAAAQKAQQASTKRRTMAEVEGLLEDEEETSTAARKPLTAIKFDTITSSVPSGLSEEERAQAARQLAAEIPSDKEGLWNWSVAWDFVDEAILTQQLKPFVEKKIVEYLGVQEQLLVDVVEEHVRQHGSPQDLVDALAEALDEEAEVLVKKLWRMIIFFSESEKRGLSA